MFHVFSLTKKVGWAYDWLVSNRVFSFHSNILIMVILMGKSKFYSVGMDNSKMFEPTYMDRMVNLAI